MNLSENSVVPLQLAQADIGSSPLQAGDPSVPPAAASPSDDAASDSLRPVEGGAEKIATEVGGEGAASEAPALESLNPTSAAESAEASTGLIPPGLLPEQADGAVQLIIAGGPIVWLLGVLSVISLAIILVKIGQFLWLSPESERNIKRSLDHWRRGDSEQAMAALRLSHRTQSILFEAMRGLSEQRDLALLQRELSRQANALIYELRSLLRPLEIIANMSPLLGLMGTVVGMILAFQQMEAAGSQVDPSLLSGGIWQALLTTAAGLAVAIPVAVLHGLFERKVERVSHLINDAVTQVFTAGLGATGLDERSPQPSDAAGADRVD